MIFRKKKDEKAKEFQENVVLTEEGRPTPLPEDYVASLGRSVYMIIDPEVTALLNPHDADGKPVPSQLRSLIPAFSHLNRTIQIQKKDAELLHLDYEYLDHIHTLNMDEDQYENYGWALLESLKIYARGIIADAIEGYKGKLVSYQLKIIRTELEEKKK